MLFAICVVVAVQAARLGAAGFHSQTAHRENEPRAAEIHVRESLGYVDRNPAALERAAALDVARMRVASNPGEAQAAAQEARTHYRRALAERPTSPFLWANLALAKMYLDEFDAEMFSALRQADELGPWEPTVQQTTVFVGLAAWHKLDAGLKARVERAVERAGRRETAKAYEIVKAYGRLDLVCRLKDYQPLAARDCFKRK